MVALHILHHQEEELVLDADVDRRHHVRVADARGQASLVQEHRHQFRLVEQMGVGDLDGQQTLEVAHSAYTTHVHGTHPSRSQSVQYVVAPQTLPLIAVDATHVRQAEAQSEPPAVAITRSDPICMATVKGAGSSAPSQSVANRATTAVATPSVRVPPKGTLVRSSMSRPASSFSEVGA